MYPGAYQNTQSPVRSATLCHISSSGNYLGFKGRRLVLMSGYKNIARPKILRKTKFLSKVS